MDTKEEKVQLFLIECPYCKQIIEITEINCGIFRHGIYKSNNEQIDPHMSKEDCIDLVIKDLIYGCGRPFRIVDSNNAEMCDYI